MKIYILDKYKITKFNLPEKIEDSFLIPYSGYNNKKDNFITIEAEDNKWKLKSNGNSNIISNSGIIESATINNYSQYFLKVLGQNDNLSLYALPSDDSESYNLALNDLTNISIGSSLKCNISYRNNLTGNLHAEIKNVNGTWYIAGNANDKYRIYVNEDRVLTSKLRTGDVIFINGLKIIWMKTFLKINNPLQQVTVTGLSAYKEVKTMDNTKYTPVSDEEANINLYEEDDYFYHTPRLVPTIVEEEIDIDAPPGGENSEELPFILTVGTSFTMFASSGVMIYNLVSSILQGAKINRIIPQIIMCVSMLIGSLLMPRIMKAYEKRRKKRKEQERQTKYKAYLDKMNLKIQNALKQESQILKENNLSVKECYDIIMNKGRKLWQRETNDEDFLRIRLGIGNIDSSVVVTAPQEKFSLTTDNLQSMVFEVDKNSKKLTNVPVTINIDDYNVLSFIVNCSYAMDYINGIIIQLLALHSAGDLKIVILTNEKNKKRWEFTRFLTHCWSEDGTKRFFATNQDEYKEISTYLEEIFKLKQDESTSANSKDGESETEGFKKKYKSNPPYYLIIADDYKHIKRLPIIEKIENSSENYGFSILAISNDMKNLSNKCVKFVEIGENESCILEKKLSSQSQVIFKNEYEKNMDMNVISIKLSNIPIFTKDAMMSLPTSLSFLEMYGVSKVEQLNILNRWQINNPVTSLAAPVGVHVDGELFKLDLHEKFHGPHGLIAGSTGSGKSEFIITFILSMCVNYHPYEVQFVLIDYKGGGLAGAFENKETGVRVPHLVGTITNLDTAEMNRTLVSISSELKRRQKKFNEVKDKLQESTIDIYKYQKFYREGLIDEPMAHLFIISDEFAELKSQQPEFLAELVSTARIGRSLGVHLILATQKPSGVVSDQIWSNSKFKVCLKVQDRGDSMEMLKKPDAASIKEAGRFYLQVGYDDYFDVGQSGWGGAKYVPTDRIIKKVDDSINFIGHTGNIIKSINDIVKKDTNEDLGEQLTNVVKYIYNLSLKENIVKKQMWLDKIPDIIYIDNIKKKYNYKPTPYKISPVIGEYDNPAAQEQGILTLNLYNNGLIYGQGGSGKENLLTTILWSSIVEHTPDEVNFYVIDCGAETLKMFYKMPHVGEVMGAEETDKIIDTFSMIANEIDRRKTEYMDYAGSYKNYCENSGKKDPLIVTIINGYESFCENYGKLSEQIQTLYRDGYKYGVTFLVSCISASAIRGKMLQSFEEKITMQMPNNDDYRSILPAPRGLIPSKIFGRGLVEKNDTAYEFQTAYITEPKNINNVVREASKQLSDAYTTRAKRIPTIPDIVTIDSFKNVPVTLNNFPIGYAIDTKLPTYYDISKNKILSIVSEDMQNRLDFVKAFVKQLHKIPGLNIKIVDFVNALGENIDNIPIANKDFNKEIVLINNAIANEKKSQKNNLYIIVGIGEFQSELNDTTQKILSNLIMASDSFEKSQFIFIDNYSSYKKLEVVDWFNEKINKENGIWLGQNIGNQMAFNVLNLNVDIKNLNFPQLGFIVKNKNYEIIKYMVDVEGEINEK